MPAKYFEDLSFNVVGPAEVSFAKMYGEKVSSGVVTAYAYNGCIYVTDINNELESANCGPKETTEKMIKAGKEARRTDQQTPNK